MVTPDAMQLLLDEAALRRTAELYAQGADRRASDLWRAVLADDCVIEGPGFRQEGMAQNLAALELLDTMFKATQHRVHQQCVRVDGNAASGETYCTADHLLKDGDAILSWAIRYQDSWRRESDGWRFTQRKLLVDWQETRPVMQDWANLG